MVRLAVFNCEDTEKWKASGKPRSNIEGHINAFVEMFADTYGEPEDSWKAYACYDYEWPTVEEAKSFDAILITGSHHCSYDLSQEWIDELCSMVRLYVQENIKLVGVCFGAQVLGKALGGEVGKNPGIFAAKVEDLEVLPVFQSFLGGIKNLDMIVSHGDQVLELPPDAVRLATSQNCKNEIWCLRSVLAIQPHPEFIPSIMLDIILPALKQRRKMTPDQIRQSEKNLKSKKPTHEPVIAFIKRFTRSDDFIKSAPYRTLFPSHLNSTSDRDLIQQIKQRTEEMAQLPISQSSGVRNPELDTETKQLVQQGIKELTEQFSTLMLKELNRTLVEYEGLKSGNAVVYQQVKDFLTQALELYEPIKELRSDRILMTGQVNQVIRQASEMINSLEESAQLLERQTKELRQRIHPAK